jgi:hypothetical protein
MNESPDAQQTELMTELDAATADLFDLDVQVGPATEDLPKGCSPNCTDDGCSSPTKC